MWQATTMGGLAGFLAGLALEAARELRDEQITQRVIEEFESKGMSPPLMVETLRPSFIPVATCVLFAVLSTSIYLIWSLRK